MPRSRSRSRSRSKSPNYKAFVMKSHVRSRSRSRSGSRRKGCRGGSTLKQLRKAAKSCGLKGYSKMKKCTLSRKVKEATCGNVHFVSRKRRSQKKYKTRSRKGSYRFKHRWAGKRIVFQ